LTWALTKLYKIPMIMNLLKKGWYFTSLT